MSRQISTLVVGCRYQQNAAPIIAALRVNDPIELRREPGNPADPLAVACYSHNARIGFLARPTNAEIAAAMDRGIRVSASITATAAVENGTVIATPHLSVELAEPI